MYENEYYFIRKPKGREDLPFLKPDKNTSNRHFRFEALPDKPLLSCLMHGKRSARQRISKRWFYEHVRAAA